MGKSLDVKFGPWAPDLQNIATEIPDSGVVTVPCSDVLNVYYQDAAYRCLPTPVAQASALTEQILNAYSWYDTTAGQQIVFEAASDNIYALIDQAYQIFPAESAISVSVVGLKMTLTVHGTNNAVPNKINITLGSISAVGGSLLIATMIAGEKTGSFGFQIGYSSAQYGSLSPNKDANGNVIIGIINNSNGVLTLTYAGTAPQNYFTKLIISGASFSSSLASYTTTSNPATSVWTWSNVGVFLNNGTSYSVKINH